MSCCFLLVPVVFLLIPVGFMENIIGLQPLLAIDQQDQPTPFFVGRLIILILHDISLNFSILALYFIIFVGLLVCWPQNITHTHRENIVK